MKTLLISGSPRKGNTEFILNKIYDSLNGEKELVLLKNKNIQHCRGCFACKETKRCVMNDDMAEILDKMVWADTIVIGTPSYYYNVSGLLKDFMDRTIPLYETGKFTNKKIVVTVTYGEEDEGNKMVGNMIKAFADINEMNFISAHYFKGLDPDDVKNIDVDLMSKIIKEIEK
ncbi:MAG: flavodoxin family protein [Candidatus Staskawiczbacteria bacterium]